MWAQNYSTACGNPLKRVRRRWLGVEQLLMTYDSFQFSLRSAMPNFSIAASPHYARTNGCCWHLLPVHQSLGQCLATIDGKDPPTAFNKLYISRIVQSPLAAYIPLHSASCYQATLQGLQYQECAEAISIEIRTMSLIREYFEKNRNDLQVDAILAVFLLLENEVSLNRSWSLMCADRSWNSGTGVTMTIKCRHTWGDSKNCWDSQGDSKIRL